MVPVIAPEPHPGGASAAGRTCRLRGRGEAGAPPLPAVGLTAEDDARFGFVSVFVCAVVGP